MNSTNKHRVRDFIVQTGVGISIVIQCSGCESAFLFSRHDREIVNAGNKAIVLLRVESEGDEQARAFPNAWGEGIMNEGITFGLATFESAGTPTLPVFNKFISSESRNAGWTYLLLPAGLFYIAAFPPRDVDVNTWDRMLPHFPRWRIDVPVGARLLYVGTVQLRWSPGVILQQGPIRDDSDLATQLLSRDFPDD